LINSTMCCGDWRSASFSLSVAGNRNQTKSRPLGPAFRFLKNLRSVWGQFLPAKLPPTAPTHVAIVWNGITQNIVGRPIVVWRIARSSVVAIVAVKVRVLRARWVRSSGWAILSHGKRRAAEQQGRRQADSCRSRHDPLHADFPNHGKNNRQAPVVPRRSATAPAGSNPPSGPSWLVSPGQSFVADRRSRCRATTPRRRPTPPPPGRRTIRIGAQCNRRRSS
jgi:hypothetical protein